MAHLHIYMILYMSCTCNVHLMNQLCDIDMFMSHGVFFGISDCGGCFHGERHNDHNCFSALIVPYVTTK